MGEIALAYAPSVADDGVRTSTPAALATAVAAVVLAATTALARRAEPAAADRSLLRWLNDPPAALDAVWSVAGPLFRPVPLAGLVVVLTVWVVATAAPTLRSRVVRHGLAAAALAWALAWVLKAWTDRPRPPAVLPGVLTHAYPRAPGGSAFPSAHTAVAVAVAVALWPLVGRVQRVVLVVVAVMVAVDRVYIGAHWPLDVLGGVAIGVLAAGVILLVAARRSWPGARSADGVG